MLSEQRPSHQEAVACLQNSRSLKCSHKFTPMRTLTSCKVSTGGLRWVNHLEVMSVPGAVGAGGGNGGGTDGTLADPTAPVGASTDGWKNRKMFSRVVCRSVGSCLVGGTYDDITSMAGPCHTCTALGLTDVAVMVGSRNGTEECSNKIELPCNVLRQV